MKIAYSGADAETREKVYDDCIKKFAGKARLTNRFFFKERMKSIAQNIAENPQEKLTKLTAEVCEILNTKKIDDFLMIVIFLHSIILILRISMKIFVVIWLLILNPTETIYKKTSNEFVEDVFGDKDYFDNIKKFDDREYCRKIMNTKIGED